MWGWLHSRDFYLYHSFRKTPGWNPRLSALKNNVLKVFPMGVPLWLRGLRTHLVSMRMWVQSLALFGGLRIWHGHKLQSRL